jgi:uncharacterized paraquat-inducible protein A
MTVEQLMIVCVIGVDVACVLSIAAVVLALRRRARERREHAQLH